MDTGFNETITVKRCENGWFIETSKPGFTWREVYTNPIELLGRLASSLGIHGKIEYGGDSFIA